MKLERVAQDGVKVRASAGASSFHRRKTLEEHLAEAQRQVQTLKQEVDADPAAGNRRHKKARQVNSPEFILCNACYGVP